ncbi:MAG TPA: glycosyltransferase [Vicinamibacteria bacterium]|nr:glycosyltransferase [Vicinamibacteria bacterium]
MSEAPPADGKGSPPRVSVLVAAYESEGSIRSTLEALREQTRPPHEVLVVESSGDGTAALVQRDFPEVLLLVSRERLFPGAARQLALPRVTGEGVACLDADCAPDPEWLMRLARAIEDGASMVAGAVVNAPDSTVVGWAYFLSEFVPWLPGPTRELFDAPTCNTAYRTLVLRNAGGFPDHGLLSADSLLHWRLARMLGHGLAFVPAARVRHAYRGSAAAMLRRRFVHGRSLSTARHIHRPRGLWARLPWALIAALLLPVFYLVRLCATAFGHPDVPRRAFIQALPLTTLALVLWAWGQAVGLVSPSPAEASR